MIKVAICDDVPIIVNTIKKMLDRHHFSEEIEIELFTSGERLIKQTMKEKYDIVLMDIELSQKETESGINGMVVANKIKEYHPQAILIFFTGNLGHERKLLNYEPFRYILKPVMQKEVIEALEAAISRINKWESKFFEVKMNGIAFNINLNDIILLSSTRPYIDIRCINNNDDIRFRGKMDDAEEKISNLTDDFLRPNKSCLINQKYITDYTSKDITMINNEIISVTKKYQKEFFGNFDIVKYKKC